MSSVIRDFSKLNEEQMVAFKYPSFVSELMQEYKDGRYSKDSDSFRNFNSAVTAINLLKACARLNLAIYALRDKYKIEEAIQYQNRWINQRSYSIGTQDWYKSTDEDVLKIKNAAIDARDKIHGYSKKYTIEGFEENFIDTVKYGVYAICRKFMVETRTVTQKAADAGGNVLAKIIVYGLFILLFILVGKCATGQ